MIVMQWEVYIVETGETERFFVPPQYNSQPTFCNEFETQLNLFSVPIVSTLLSPKYFTDTIS